MSPPSPPFGGRADRLCSGPLDILSFSPGPSPCNEPPPCWSSKSQVVPFSPDDPEVVRLLERAKEAGLPGPPKEYEGRQVFPGVRHILNLQDVLDCCNRYG